MLEKFQKLKKIALGFTVEEVLFFSLHFNK